MKSYYTLIGIAAYIISYLIVFSIYQKFDLEKIINRKTSRRVCLFLISILYGIAGSLIIDNLNIIREYRFIIDSFFVTGPATAFFVFALPVKRNITKS